MGIKLESGELIIRAPEGVAKARDLLREPEDGERDGGSDSSDGFKGVPWEPSLGAAGGYEIKSTVRLPTESGELTKVAKLSARRFWRQGDFESGRI